MVRKEELDEVRCFLCNDELGVFLVPEFLRFSWKSPVSGR